MTCCRTHTCRTDSGGGRGGWPRGHPGTCSTSITRTLPERAPVQKPPKSPPTQGQLEAQSPPANPKSDHLVSFRPILCQAHRVRVPNLAEAWVRRPRAGHSALLQGHCPHRARTRKPKGPGACCRRTRGRRARPSRGAAPGTPALQGCGAPSSYSLTLLPPEHEFPVSTICGKHIRL